jgi:hypothetical protein
MSELLPDQLEAFLSKQEFNFATVAGWEEFFAERRSGGAGRDADGVQLRDLKNFAVATAMVITSGSPAIASFWIRSLGTGLSLAPGVMYVYYKDAAHSPHVKTFYVGPPGSSMTVSMEVGGGGTQSSPDWGALYYIILKSGDLPGQSVAESVAKRVVNNALKGAGWLARRGTRFLMMGGAGYTVQVQVGNGAPQRDEFMPQEILSDATKARIEDMATRALETVTESPQGLTDWYDNASRELARRLYPWRF